MREIKFRAWDKDGKEMIEANGFYQKADSKISGNGLHLSDFLGINKDGTIGKEHENIVLMQFTGLHDKNGKEIYEGDLVKWHGDSETDYVEERVDKVEWDNERTGFYPMTFEYGWRADIRSIEVIGNIYENQELLEKTK